MWNNLDTGSCYGFHCSKWLDWSSLAGCAIYVSRYYEINMDAIYMDSIYSNLGNFWNWIIWKMGFVLRSYMLKSGILFPTVLTFLYTSNSPFFGFALIFLNESASMSSACKASSIYIISTFKQRFDNKWIFLSCMFSKIHLLLTEVRISAKNAILLK